MSVTAVNTFPLVSVIIPNYNHARFLDKRISSVLNQTYQNIEIIVLDDVSTDNSIEVIKKYLDNPKISQFVVNDENSGNTFLQWEKGLHLAKGELVWIAESDDWCETNMLEELVKAYNKYPDTAIAYSTSLLVEESGRQLWPVLNARNRYYSGKQYLKRYLLFENFIMNASSAVFNKDKALSIPKDYMTIKGAGDYYFWTELAGTGRVAIVNKALNRFVRHPGAITDDITMIISNCIQEKKIYDVICRCYHINAIRKRLAKIHKQRIANDLIKYTSFSESDVCNFYCGHKLCRVELFVDRVLKHFRTKYQYFI